MSFHVDECLFMWMNEFLHWRNILSFLFDEAMFWLSSRYAKKNYPLTRGNYPQPRFSGGQ
jgi:hypothetical protein